ncbi:MAG: response regulator [Candidatus Omnitrophica bacterium]|jgi:CheY-like chemotaxis protein|nr:response regulator [Candidatus Omnitrophota bacterium]MDD3274974.1 response regulator [Candidatus Omnitrophota bacterium]MDD5077620.1 response regulator [Candidatus Omnitrophota bacterium]
MDGTGIRVLVVDDEADFRNLMTFWLESKGYKVITAPDGKAAIELVKQKKADIVFMDLRMPVMDGVDALKSIRSFDTVTPIIIISSYIADPKIQEARSHGMSGVFYKGADFDASLPLLEMVLRTHRNLKK